MQQEKGGPAMACEWAGGWAPASGQGGGGENKCEERLRDLLPTSSTEQSNCERGGRRPHNSCSALGRERRGGHLGMPVCCMPGSRARRSPGRTRCGACSRRAPHSHRLSLHNQLALAGGQLEDLILGGVHAHAVDVADLMWGRWRRGTLSCHILALHEARPVDCHRIVWPCGGQ